MTCSKHTAQAQIIMAQECPKVLRLNLKVCNQCGEHNNLLEIKSHHQPEQRPHLLLTASCCQRAIVLPVPRPRGSSRLLKEERYRRRRESLCCYRVFALDTLLAWSTRLPTIHMADSLTPFKSSLRAHLLNEANLDYPV